MKTRATCKDLQAGNSNHRNKLPVLYRIETRVGRVRE
jgi:hypothetical protein